MSEIFIDLQDPLGLLGVNDANLDNIRKGFPDIKIIARGGSLKAIGDQMRIEQFREKLHLMEVHLERFGVLTPGDILLFVEAENEDSFPVTEPGDELILHGRDGKLIKAKTPNQQRLAHASVSHDLVFAIGPAGTGKTYTAVALAVRALKNKEVKRIILTRPAVEAGESLGFLPGDLRDKLDPYLQPLYDALRDMLPHQKLLSWFEDSTIEIAPLAFMRGRTLDHAFVILDEAQNASVSQMKMFLTRMGNAARFIVTGDVTQIDLPRGQASGLIHVRSILQGIQGIEFIELDERDIVRHPLVGRIIKAFDSTQTNQHNKT
jgi:phosphate starvation-inducible protein PhoH and related proteins